LAIATSWAEVTGAHRIYIGAVAEDSSGYPDCRPEFYDAFQQTIDAGTKPDTHIEIHTPIINLRKSEIIKRGLELGAPLELTWQQFCCLPRLSLRPRPTRCAAPSRWLAPTGKRHRCPERRSMFTART